MVDWATVGTSFVVAGGGAAAIALGVFKFVGSKWIESRFASQLERSRQDHTTATEHLKGQIAGLLDRTQKLNHREFETLPDIWQKADKAYAAAQFVLSPLRTYPNLPAMTNIEFEEFLASCDLPQSKKNELVAAAKSDRLHVLSRMMKWSELGDANEAVKIFLVALSGGSIYLHPQTHDRLKYFADKMARAIYAYRYDLQDQYEHGESTRTSSHVKEFRDHGEKWFRELGDFLRNRLWSESSEPLPEKV